MQNIWKITVSVRPHSCSIQLILIAFHEIMERVLILSLSHPWNHTCMNRIASTKRYRIHSFRSLTYKSEQFNTFMSRAGWILWLLHISEAEFFLALSLILNIMKIYCQSKNRSISTKFEILKRRLNSFCNISLQISLYLIRNMTSSTSKTPLRFPESWINDWEKCATRKIYVILHHYHHLHNHLQYLLLCNDSYLDEFCMENKWDWIGVQLHMFHVWKLKQE